MDEYSLGYLDCSEGVEHVPGKSEAYNAGYGSRYAQEQQMNAQSEAGHE